MSSKRRAQLRPQAVDEPLVKVNGTEPLVTTDGVLSESDFLDAIIAQPEFAEIAGKGKVEIRGLSTLEVQQVIAEATKNGAQDTALLMTHAVLRGMVRPKLSESHIEKLLRAGGGYILPLAQRIMVLSGMTNLTDLEKKVGDGSSPTAQTESDLPT